MLFMRAYVAYKNYYDGDGCMLGIAPVQLLEVEKSVRATCDCG